MIGLCDFGVLIPYGKKSKRSNLYISIRRHLQQGKEGGFAQID